MNRYSINFRKKINDGVYTVKFFDFFRYFLAGSTKSVFTNPFLKSFFSMTGFLTMARFKEAVKNYVLSEQQSARDIVLDRISLPEEVILLIRNEIFKNLEVFRLKRYTIRIILFPCFGENFRKNFNGVSAYTVPSGKLFFIFLYKNFQLNRFSKRELKKAIAHEFNHLVFEEYHHNWQGMIDNIIAEGLAGHFEAHIDGGSPSKFFLKFSRQRCLKSWPKVKKILYSYEWKVYDNLFNYYNEHFPLGFGYSLGYQIVGDFLKKNKTLSWPKIMKMSSQEILEKSGWLDY